MRAVEIAEPGGPDVLRVVERPRPAPGHGEVQIRLAYVGVNRPDALQRAGAYDPPPGASDLPGLEGAGEIAAIGPGVTDWQVGDAVCALLPGGGYAEYAVTHAAHCLRVPEGMDLKQAACLPETFFTVWSNVFTRGGLQGGDVTAMLRDLLVVLREVRTDVRQSNVLAEVLEESHHLHVRRRRALAAVVLGELQQHVKARHCCGRRLLRHALLVRHEHQLRPPGARGVEDAQWPSGQSRARGSAWKISSSRACA